MPLTVQAGAGNWMEKACYSFKGTSGEINELKISVFNEIAAAKILQSGYPAYARTEIVGEYSKPHTLKAVPVSSMEAADSILIDDKRFIKFSVWGLNARAVFMTDIVYLTKEKDAEAAANGMKGFHRYKYAEIDYGDLFIFGNEDVREEDYQKAEKILSLMRQGLQKAGCKKVKCN